MMNARSKLRGWTMSSTKKVIVAAAVIALAGVTVSYAFWDRHPILLAHLSRLLGNDYDAFVRIVRSSCTDYVQQNEALQKQETSGVTRRQLDVFCECYANALAKELTAAELRTALNRTDHVTQQMKDRVSGAAPACRRQAFALPASTIVAPCPSGPNVVWLTNCKGTLSGPDGSQYVGEFKDNKKNGRGIQTWPNKSQYVGEFRDDKQNGQGAYTWVDGSEYVGEFRDNMQFGQGTHTAHDGSKYVGEFKYSMPDGQGTYTSPEGSKYIGEFKDGLRNGHGEFTFANGDRYVGEFKDGTMNGKGTYVWADSGKTRSGIWKNDRLVKWSPGIPIEIEEGTFIVPVTINGKITLNFTIDSGASDVSVPADVVSTLIRTGSITKEDFFGEEQYRLADGSIVPSPVFLIRSLRVGDIVVENVRASVASARGSLLLGQSFLNRFNSWSVDNRERLLFLN
jgi:clan AA aspartic protease (TIGR02281 family)